jgi:Tfp pilus assembly protein PilZ
MRILKARFRDRREFLEAYNEDLPNGGLFCPTTTALDEDEAVVAEIHFPGLPNKMMVRGTVVWWRAALPRLRVRAGAMIAFAELEKEKKDYILEVASGRRNDGIKRRHARIPIEMPVRWRRTEETSLRDSHLREISVGGALLLLDGEKLAAGEEVILELTTPGGAQPISIVARVTYAGSAGAGLRFIYRDGGGSQRLREVVRRLVMSAEE